MSRRVVVITGCRSGFGLMAAVSAAKSGWTVYAGLRALDTGDALRAACDGLDVHPVQLDVTDDDQRRAVIDRVLQEQGRIDALVNNAGRPLGGFLEQLEEDELRSLFDVNVFGVFSLTNLVLPTMRAQGAGSIINVSSVAGRMAMPGLGAYASSKFALEGMTEALRHELRSFGIRVVLIEPGPYKTDIFSRNKVLGRNVNDPSSPYAAQKDRLERAAEAVHKRAGDPDDVGQRIVDVLEGRKTQLRHPMGASAHIRLNLRKVMPAWAYEMAIARDILHPSDGGHGH